MARLQELSSPQELAQLQLGQSAQQQMAPPPPRPTEAEQWGNVMVRVEDAVVTGNDFQYEVFAADDGSGSILVDDDSDSVAAFFEVLVEILLIGVII